MGLRTGMAAPSRAHWAPLPPEHQFALKRQQCACGEIRRLARHGRSDRKRVPSGHFACASRSRIIMPQPPRTSHGRGRELEENNISLETL